MNSELIFSQQILLILICVPNDLDPVGCVYAPYIISVSIAKMNYMLKTRIYFL